MSEWITDRRPTEDDADVNGVVLLSYKFNEVHLADFDAVKSGDAWMPMPKPYEPPSPDTSLSASIERKRQRVSATGNCLRAQPCFCEICDDGRILEAAMKWDEIEKHDDCVVDPYLSNVCSRGTKGCHRTHDDIGESEHGRKYEERTSSGDNAEAPVISSSDKPKRRRRWCYVRKIHDSVDDATYDPPVPEIAEVLPDDPDPEWVDQLLRLIRLYELSGIDWSRVKKHLTKRGEK